MKNQLLLLPSKSFILFLFIIVLIFSSTTSYSQNSNQLALLVLDLSVEYGIDEALSVPVTQRFRQELQNTGAFRVIDRNEMIQKLSSVGINPANCRTAEKAAEAGKSYGTERVITGSFSKIGNMITISVKMINSLTGQVVSSHSMDCNCPIEEVITTTLSQLAAKVAGQTPPAVVASSEPATAPTQPETYTPPQSTYTSAPVQKSQTPQRQSQGNFRDAKEHFGVQLGIDFSNIIVDNGQEYFKSRSGLALGFGLEFNANKTISFRPEIWVHSRGCKVEIADETTDWKITYYSLPFLVKFNIGTSRTIYPSFYIGPEFSYVVLMELGDLKTSDEDDKDSLKDLFHFTDVGLTLGATMHINKFYVDLRYYEGIKNILKEIEDTPNTTQQDDASRKNRTISFTVGYHFR